MVHADVNEDMQTEHPDWHLWRSGGGSWMATRRNVLSIGEVFPDLDNTLMENSAEDLAEKLAEQKRLEAAA